MATKKSRTWIQNHKADEYVQKAQRDGYRSRASYKFIEIDEKFGLVKPGQVIVDLGAAPGGWSQVVAKRAGDVIAIDLLPMDPIDGVTIIEGDFTIDAILEQMMERLAGRPVDLVISDMAPNLSGVKDIDQPRHAYLLELAIDFAQQVLKPGGALVAKCFEGEGIEEIRRGFRANFKQVSNVKPKASRPKSREVYLVGRGFQRKS